MIERLGLEPTAWTELVREFGKLFHCVAGHPDNVDRLRSYPLISRVVAYPKPKQTIIDFDC